MRKIILIFLVLLVASCKSSSSGEIFSDSPMSPVVIGASGGSVKSSDGKARLIIPAGALEEEIEINFDVFNPGEEIGGGSARFYSGLPDGLVFNAPVTIEAIVSDIYDTDSLPLIISTSVDFGSEFLSSQKVEKDFDSNQTILSAKVSHFSNFTILSSTLIPTIENVPFSATANNDFGPVRPTISAKLRSGLDDVLILDRAVFTDVSSLPVQIKGNSSVELVNEVRFISQYTTEPVSADVPYRCSGNGLGEFRANLAFNGRATVYTRYREDVPVFALVPGFFFVEESVERTTSITKDFETSFTGRRIVNCVGAGDEIVEPTPTPVIDDESSQPEETPVPTPSVSQGGFAALESNKSSLSFTHKVGQSSCPQTIGTVRITNTGTLETNVTPRLSTVAISVDTAGFSLAPGESRTVTILFTCSQASSFEGTVSFIGSGNDGAQADVSISGSVG